jgi:putative glycosyltransferase (TIGR04372 family)
VSINVGSAAGLLHSLREVNGLVVTNITGDVFGHVIPEIDNYARLRISGEVSQETPCMLFATPDKMIKSILEMFPGMFEITSLELVPQLFSEQIVNCHPELGLDVGISSYKISPPTRGYERTELGENKVIYRTNFINGIYSDMIKYFKRIKATPDFHPLRIEVPCPASLHEFLDTAGQSIVVMHQRKVMSAGTKVLVSDDLYVPTLKYLKDNNYTIVFSGREKFPDDWRKYGVIDYANSKYASIKNDFHLYRMAKFGLLAASGTNLLAETQCMPYVQINSSQGAIPTYSMNSIILPSMWNDNETSQMASAAKHIQNNLVFGIGYASGMSMQSITSQDLLSATQELEQLIEDWTPRTELQNKWIKTGKDIWEGRTLTNGRSLWDEIGFREEPWIGGNDELLDGQNEESLLTLADSRISQKFLERHQEVLFD